jgi:hypothetical protein
LVYERLGINEDMAKQTLLTLREAAEIAGVRRKEIRDRVARGEIAVRVLGTGRGAKLRLTESALADAGLIAGELAPIGTSGELSDLIQLVREQQARITALEEQRFQIAGQLGASLERTLALQNQLIELTESLQTHPQVLQATSSSGQVTPPPEAVAEDSQMEERGPEDASAPTEEPASLRASVVARTVVSRLASSNPAQRGKSGILRLRTVRWRSTR